MLIQGTRAPRAVAHLGRRAGPHPEAQRQAPCGAATSSSMIHPSIKMTLRARNTCCKSMFQVFNMFHLDVAIISCGCCKSRSGCCICCNRYTRMLQAFVHIVSVVFQRMLQVCLSKCCICFIWMLYIFCNSFFKRLGVFISVSDVCCKCFNCFRAYIENVSFGCLKNRADVASPSSPSAARLGVSSSRCW